jgi:hypothetical protein
MSLASRRSQRLLLVCIPALIVAVGCGARLLPPAIVVHVVTYLSLWVALSLPMSILVGHCALSED